MARDDRLNSATTRPLDGVWVVWTDGAVNDSEGSYMDVLVFRTEVEALRCAVAQSMTSTFVPFGQSPREAHAAGAKPTPSTRTRAGKPTALAAVPTKPESAK